MQEENKLEIPPQFQQLKAFIKRAEELDLAVDNPRAQIVAYYCRLYAIDIGMKLNVPANERKFLFELLTVIEKSPRAKLSNEVAKGECENFALQVFAHADNEDRTTGSTKFTAKAFYSAATYFDILEQFGELEPDVWDMLFICLFM